MSRSGHFDGPEFEKTTVDIDLGLTNLRITLGLWMQSCVTFCLQTPEEKLWPLLSVCSHPRTTNTLPCSAKVSWATSTPQPLFAWHKSVKRTIYFFRCRSWPIKNTVLTLEMASEKDFWSFAHSLQQQGVLCDMQVRATSCFFRRDTAATNVYIFPHCPKLSLSRQEFFFFVLCSYAFGNHRLSCRPID